MPNPLPQRCLRRDQKGLTTVEYLIVLGLIAVFGVAAWRTFGTVIARETGEAGKQMQVVSTPTATSSGAATASP